MSHAATRHSAGVELIAEALRRYGAAQFRVQGGSMRPLLRAGDLLRVRRTGLSDLRFGEVAVFERGGGIFAHRVIGRKFHGGETVLITQGDSFRETDAPVRAAELLGRATTVVRGQRKISLDALGPRTIGKLAACVSVATPVWYPGARAVKRMFRFKRS